jgi:hypothetical protein
MRAALPGWAVSNRESVRREAARYAAMTPEERAQHLLIAVSAGEMMLESRTDRDRVRGYRDPLPESTLRALARLRAEAARLRRAPGGGRRPEHTADARGRR